MQKRSIQFEKVCKSAFSGMAVRFQLGGGHEDEKSSQQLLLQSEIRQQVTDIIKGSGTPLIECSELSQVDTPAKKEPFIGKGLEANVYPMLYAQKQLVAVKEYKIPPDRKATVLPYLLNELRVYSKGIKHKCFLKLVGVSIRGCSVLLAMEMCNKKQLLSILYNLQSALKYKEFPARWVAALSELASCLSIMHDLGILHRDLQANNILVQQQMEELLEEAGSKEITLKICDFGSSSLIGQPIAVLGGSRRHYAPEALKDASLYCK